MRFWPVALFVASLSGCDDDSSPQDPTGDTQVDMAVSDAVATPDGAVDDASAGDDAQAGDGSFVDAAPDAAVGLRPDRLPHSGPDLDGAPDLAAPVPAGQARAGRVTAAGQPGSPTIDCRPGCFRLENAVVTTCIEGLQTNSPLLFHGGNLIDAERADRPGTDVFLQHFLAPALGQVRAESVKIVADGADGGPAIIQIEGRPDLGRMVHNFLPVVALPTSRFITEYRLQPDSDTLQIDTWIHADQGSDNVQLYEFFDFGSRALTFKPGTPLDDFAPSRSEFLAASAERVSYGVSNVGAPIDAISLPADVIPIAPVVHGSIGLQADDMVLLERELRIGTGDIESVRPISEAHLPVTLTGPANVWIDIDDGAVSVSRVRLSEAGEATVHLEAGSYRAVVSDWPGGIVDPVAIEVPAAAPIPIDAPDPATLVVEVTDAEGAPLVAQLILVGPADGNRRDYSFGGRVITAPAGEYTLQTTRGWHFTADSRTVNLAAGETTRVDVTLTEIIPFEGWSHGEFHQHTEMSLDSVVAVQRRVLDNAGAGVGFMVPSDHDNLFDFAPVIAQMGLQDVVAGPITGLEVSPLIAHLGAYGIPQDHDKPGSGAPALMIKAEDGTAYRRNMVELMAAAREAGAEFLQVNHPHASQAFLEASGFDPAGSIDDIDSPHWSTDFDTMEIYNERGLFCVTLIDWLSMLNQGMQVTAIGNSDTHGEGGAGFPRNYLPTAAAASHLISKAEVISAMREGRSFIGGLGVLDFPGGPQPGDTVRTEGTLSLPVRLRSAQFSQFDRLIVFVNGQPVIDRAIESALEDVLDFEETLEIPIARDGNVVVVALGPQTRAFDVGDQPIGVSNPIFIDADGDGTVTPPGPGLPTLPAGLAICQ